MLERHQRKSEVNCISITSRSATRSVCCDVNSQQNRSRSELDKSSSIIPPLLRRVVLWLTRILLNRSRRRCESLKAQVAALEKDLASGQIPPDWSPVKFYVTYYATVGFVLGGFAAMVSLLFNVIGSTVAGKHSLEIIRVYLTFPLGARALPLGTQDVDSAFVISDGTILALGCCLYIGTGMVLGSLFHCVISRFAGDKSLAHEAASGDRSSGQWCGL